MAEIEGGTEATGNSSWRRGAWLRLRKVVVQWTWEVCPTGLCGFVAGDGTGGKQGLCALPAGWNYFESTGASLIGGKQESDKISSSLGGWGSWNLRFRAQETLMRCHSHPIYPKNVPVGENLVIQEGSVLPDDFCGQETAHHIGIPPVQILKISHFKNKVFFVEETQENIVKKNKKI